ncbi:MAG: hypothetical protein KKB46_00555 [Candidatus Omnitrophica bacterium]|nr:hypothetical protein [Candidatus Omnitrophota bacterium]
MRKIFIGIVLLYVLNFNCGASYSIDNRREIQPQPLAVQRPQAPQAPQAPQIPQIPQEVQAARPILPPVVPPSSLGASPTLSPHISVPIVTPVPINIPYTQPDVQLHRALINNIPMPSVPVYSATPVANNFTELPQIPIIGNVLGKVLNIGTDKGNLPWIEVRDEIFDETLKIKINPSTTPVIKKTTVLSFKDIKVGDAINVIFNQKDEEIIADFVSIMTEEDLKAMEKSLESKSTVVPKDKKEDILRSEE